ncbi:hypothetical protein GCM10027073_43200 [Streptomyces chlorus]
MSTKARLLLDGTLLPNVRITYRYRWEALSTGQEAVNRSHAKIRALVEQAVPTLRPTGSDR